MQRHSSPGKDGGAKAQINAHEKLHQRPLRNNRPLATPPVSLECIPRRRAGSQIHRSGDPEFQLELSPHNRGRNSTESSAPADENRRSTRPSSGKQLAPKKRRSCPYRVKKLSPRKLVVSAGSNRREQEMAIVQHCVGVVSPVRGAAQRVELEVFFTVLHHLASAPIHSDPA